MKNFFIPTLILLGFALIITLLLAFQPKPDTTVTERPIANIEILAVAPADVQLTVASQGTIIPKTESNLAIEVTGRILSIAPNFRPGGYFKKGDILLEIDPIDYKAAVAQRQSDLARAKLNYAQETALAKQAKADWEAIGKGKANPLTLRTPQLEVAKTTVASAQAALAQAKAALEKTQVRAQFDGRVLSKNVDLGQLVSPNTMSSAARLYATDYAEIRLPITERERSFLLDPHEQTTSVTLSSNGREWTGSLVRIEATIDVKSRLLYAVAEIEDPFDGETPMQRGLFVDATLKGKTIKGAYQIPSYALRGKDKVYILTSEGTLVTREIKLIKISDGVAVIRSGLNPGDQVATSPIAYFAEGMPANVIQN